MTSASFFTAISLPLGLTHFTSSSWPFSASSPPSIGALSRGAATPPQPHLPKIQDHPHPSLSPPTPPFRRLHLLALPYLPHRTCLSRLSLTSDCFSLPLHYQVLDWLNQLGADADSLSHCISRYLAFAV
mmetsp:Transcript_29015/g.46934  ORF Transcript_29015/g.46934 Transcript_29015/m.46934 type:complete len:129 (-) Transcript_29015:439-825(-)